MVVVVVVGGGWGSGGKLGKRSCLQQQEKNSMKIRMYIF